MWSDLTFGPLLQGQMRIAKLKSAYNSLSIAPRGLGCKPTYRNSWAGNFLMLDLTKQWFTGFGELSFRWIQICIGLRCVGLVSYITRLFLLLEVWDGKPTYRNSWAGNLFV